MNTTRINIQTFDDNDFFDWLTSLMITNINFSSNLSKSKKLEPLKDWIIKKTFDIFPSDYKTSLGNRIFYLVNDIHEFAKCKTCGKLLPNVSFTCYSTIYDYQNCFCSSKCSSLDHDVRQKIIKTTLKNHGYKTPFNSIEIREKAKCTIINRYGVEYSIQSKEIRNKIETTNLNVYGSRSPFGNKHVQEKAKKTWQNNYGVDNPFKSEVIRNKVKQTCRSNYGVDSPFESQKIQQKCQSTILNKYNQLSYLCTDECKQKTKEWALKTYNVDHHLKSPIIREKIKHTNIQTYGNIAGKAFSTQYFKDSMLDNYGVEYSMQSKEILDKARKRYIYNNLPFDSVPEIAFYIWLNDVKEILDIDFEYQPNILFEYVFDNKVHNYFPDFKVGDQYFEIKGDHFFKDGKMICPFRYKDWSDEQYQHICDIYEAKHQCMLKNNIIILMNNDYRFFIDYVKQIYGNKFLNQLKNK